MRGGRDRLQMQIGAAAEALARGRLRFRRPEPTAAAGPCPDVFYPPQRHPHLEVIFSRDGSPSVLVNSNWERLPPGEVWALLPGLLHAERAGGEDAPAAYDLLWIAPHGPTLGLHMTGFRRGRGYFVHDFRFALRTAALQGEVDWAAADRCGELRLQALLMAGLVEAAGQLAGPRRQAVSYRQHSVEIVRTHIEAHFREELPVEALAELVHYTPCYLNTLFRERLGVTIHRYITRLRLREADRLLRTTDRPIKQIAFAVGMTDPLYFSRLYRRHFGWPPSQVERPGAEG